MLSFRSFDLFGYNWLNYKKDIIKLSLPDDSVDLDGLLVKIFKLAFKILNEFKCSLSDISDEWLKHVLQLIEPMI